MSRVTVRPGRPLRGDAVLPGDKSITQRAILLGALAPGATRIRNGNPGADAAAALAIARALGVRVRRDRDGALLVQGGTLRESDRVLRPLAALGADLSARDGGRLPPVVVRGRRLLGAAVSTASPSAQVKSALLLAAIQAEGTSRIREDIPTRDHTERMLPRFGADVALEDGAIRVGGGAALHGAEIDVPGDPSAAAFLAAAAAIVPRSDLLLQGVGVNPTRRAFFDLLARAGATVTYEEERWAGAEPVADVRVRAGTLRPIAVGPAEAPALIDELPLVAVLAAFARGTSEVRGAGELRLKESDRIDAVAEALRAVGAGVEALPDGWRIDGKGSLRGGDVAVRGDHRIAMAFLVAGLRAREGVRVDDATAAAVSDPGFLPRLRNLTR